MKDETVVVSGRVPLNVRIDLGRVAEQKGKSVSELVASAVVQALKRWGAK